MYSESHAEKPVLENENSLNELRIHALETDMNSQNRANVQDMSDLHTDNYDHSDVDSDSIILSDCESDPDDDQVIENDSTRGSLTGKFLQTDRCIDILTEATNCKDEIPCSVKENVYFLVNNSKNTDSRQNNKKSDFSDDCGIWDWSKGATPKTYYIKFGSTYRQAYMKDGSLSYQKKTKGQISYIPHDPQADSSMVFIVHRYYAVLKKDNSYKKRATRLGGQGPHIAIVEYIGMFPGLCAHGNSTTDNEYVRLPPKVMTDITTLTGKMKPHQIFNQLSDKYDDFHQPSSIRQIRDKIYNVNKKERTVEGRNDNFADQIRHLENMVTDKDEFVRSVFRTGGQTQTIILFTDEQIKDIKTHCCTGKTVLGMDKTLNLCRMHVTVTCFKQLTIRRIKTDDNPIFLGPVLIHDSSDFATFSHFFHQLRLRLLDVPLHQLVIGSDEEKALVKAIESTFTEAQHVLCTRHLEQNARQMLTDDAVTISQTRNTLKKIFGDDGLVNADDSVCFDAMATEIDRELTMVSDKFKTYYNKRLLQTIKTKVNNPRWHNDLIKKWTKNSCESVNHLLKQTVDWKKLPLPELVKRLHDLVKGQYKRIRNALFSTREFRLTETTPGLKLPKLTG